MRYVWKETLAALLLPIRAIGVTTHDVIF